VCLCIIEGNGSKGIKEENSTYCLLLYDSVLLKVEVEKRSLA
jgi:hypothetical protein